MVMNIQRIREGILADWSPRYRCRWHDFSVVNGDTHNCLSCCTQPLYDGVQQCNERTPFLTACSPVSSRISCLFKHEN